MLAAAANALQYQEGVRSYHPNDWDRFWYLAERVVSRSCYGKQGMKPHKWAVFKFVNALQGNPMKGHVWVAQHTGVITGFLLGLVDQWFWSEERHGPMYATEAAFYSTHKGDGALFLAELEEWAWINRRVKEVSLDITSGNHTAATERLYTQCGYEKIGTTYVKYRPVETVQDRSETHG